MLFFFEATLWSINNICILSYRAVRSLRHHLILNQFCNPAWLTQGLGPPWRPTLKCSATAMYGIVVLTVLPDHVTSFIILFCLFYASSYFKRLRYANQPCDNPILCIPVFDHVTEKFLILLHLGTFVTSINCNGHFYTLKNTLENGLEWNNRWFIRCYSSFLGVAELGHIVNTPQGLVECQPVCAIIGFNFIFPLRDISLQPNTAVYKNKHCILNT